jgi:hypothetical protein
MQPHGSKYSDVTTAPMTRYVDIATGSDTNGRGTLAQPYATPIRAYQDIPPVAAHPVNIHIAAGSYPMGSFPRAINTQYIDDGSLAFFGVGDATRKLVNGGPHTVTGIASEKFSQRVTVAGAAWTADEFCGYWLRVVTGGHVGRTWPIYGNAAGNVSIQLDASGDMVHSGDTVEIIRPTTVITVNDLDIFYDLQSAATTPTGAYSRLVLANLWLDASGSNSLVQFFLHGTAGVTDGPVLDFCRMDAMAYGIYATNCALNLYQAYDLTYVAASASHITNLGEFYNSPGWSWYSSGVRADTLAMIQSEVRLYDGAISGQTWLNGANVAQYVSSAGCTYWATGSYLEAWIAGYDSTKPAVSVETPDAAIKVTVEGDCNYAVDILNCGYCYFHSACTCSPTRCLASAIRIGGAAKAVFHDAPAGFKGATVGQKAYIFAKNLGVKSDNWPTPAPVMVTDTYGAELIRIA